MLKKLLILVLLISSLYSKNTINRIFKAVNSKLTQYELTIFRNFCFLKNHNNKENPKYEEILEEYQKQIGEVSYITYKEFKRTNLGDTMHKIDSLAKKNSDAYQVMFNKLNKD